MKSLLPKFYLSKLIVKFNRIKYTFLSFTFLIALTSHLSAALFSNAEPTTKEKLQGFLDQTILAKPKQSQLGSIDTDEAKENWVKLKTFQRFGALRVLQVKAGDSAQDSINRLIATGRYEFVEPDYLRHAYSTSSTAPNDTNFTSQWGLSNMGNNPGIPGPGVANADIHALTAWANTRYDASNVIVGVIDTGALMTHQDLISNLWNNPKPNGTTSNGFQYVNAAHGLNSTVGSGSVNSGNPTDDNGHGTHVSGIIGAQGNNGLTTSGVAWSVQLMPLKFLTATGGGSTSNEISCIDFAIANGAQIINASYGSNVYSSSEYTAIQALQSAGIILVVAAGNVAEDIDLTPSYPSSYLLDNIVCVAASDNRDDVVFFSSTGSGLVDLAAPGYQILSLSNSSTTATATLSGTSMATPFVTGSLALLRAQFPTDTYRQLINRLLRHVDLNVNFNNRVETGGRLNLASALASPLNENTPFNDSFQTRAHVSGSRIAVRSSNVGASLDSLEPLIGGYTGGASLWWEWTAPVSGPVSLTTTGSNFLTLAGVFSGTSLSALNPIASARATGTSASTTASLNFNAVAGSVYEIAIDGVNGQTGLVNFTLQYQNDAFETPVVLSGISTLVTSTTMNATRQSSEPTILNNTGGHSMWYQWTAPKTGQYQVSTFSYDFDPLLAIYTGSKINGLNLVSSSKGNAINSSAVIAASITQCTFTALAGTTYSIQVDGVTDSSTTLNNGQFTLSLVDSNWQLTTADAITCGPSVAANGTVYIGSEDGNFYALNPDGTTRWTYSTGAYFDTSTSSVATDGSIYFGTSTTVYSLTPNGTLRWTYVLPTGTTTGPVTLASNKTQDDTLYIKATNNTLYSLSTQSGVVNWTYQVPGTSYAACSIAPDGTVYIGSDNATLYALTSSGTLKWTYLADAAIYNAPALDSSGNLYFGTLGGTFYGVNSKGVKLWSYTAANSISSSPALGTTGNVYFASYDHHLYAVNTTTGNLAWNLLLPSEIRASSLAIDSNGVIYVGCYDYNLYAVNSNGTINRTYATGGWVRSSPAIFGTNLYFGSYDHKLYSFNIAGNTSSSAWPMYLGGARRLGHIPSDNFGFSIQPHATLPISVGSPLNLTTSATGIGPLSFQWYLNGTAIPGATSSTYTVSSASSSDLGNYTVTVTNPTGTLTSQTLSTIVGASRLTNLSTHANVLTGNQILVSGFAVGGSGIKNVLLRGVGPTLSNFGLSGVLSQPILTLFDSNSLIVASNTGWNSQSLAGSSTLSGIVSAATATSFSQSGAFSVPVNSADSALVATLPSGSTYTTKVAGLANGTGIALSEIYDLDSLSSPSKLINISSSAYVGSGSSSLVAGFTITGTSPKTILIRGVGPTLASFQVANTLTNPQLCLYDSSGNIIESNYGWNNSPILAAAALQVGAFAFKSGSLDTAMLVTLAPGAYTTQLNGLGGTSGMGMIEIYDFQ